MCIYVCICVHVYAYACLGISFACGLRLYDCVSMCLCARARMHAMCVLVGPGSSQGRRRACRQDAFYENYFESQRESIFHSVEVLIYVFDVASDDREVRRRWWWCGRARAPRGGA